MKLNLKTVLWVLGALAAGIVGTLLVMGRLITDAINF